MKPLRGRRVLLIAPRFFGYELEIQKKLEELGALVDHYQGHPSAGFAVKALIQLWPSLLAPYSRQYFARIGAESADKDYDDILVIKGEGLDEVGIRRLRGQFPNARATLYLWDSLRNCPPTRRILHLFDRCLTIDRPDADAHADMVLRPLFYTDAYREIAASASHGSDTDVLFVGTVLADRYDVLRRVRSALPEGRRFSEVRYFAHPALFWLRKLQDPRFLRARASEFIFTPLSRPALLAMVRGTKALLDIEHPQQAGLTMRTLEALGARRKLITTNRAVLEYDFCHPNNILVIDRNNPTIPDDFLDRPYVDPPKHVYERYSLNRWVSEVTQTE